MKIAHIIPSLPNYMEYRAVADAFPDADVFAQSPQPIVEYARDESHSGLKLKANVFLEDPPVYDAVIQGSGNWNSIWCMANDKRVHTLMQRCYEGGGVVATICIGSATLGLCFDLTGIHITCFPLVKVKEILRHAGAIIHTDPVVIDRRFVTAKNQMFRHLWLDSVKEELEILGRV